MSRRSIASVLAIFLGFIGAHKFYLNRFKTGVLYFLLSFTLIPFLLSLLIDLPVIRAVPIRIFNNVYSEEGYDMSNIEKKQFFFKIVKNYVFIFIIVLDILLSIVIIYNIISHVFHY